jgi:hypothetical protein
VVARSPCVSSSLIGWYAILSVISKSTQNKFKLEWWSKHTNDYESEFELDTTIRTNAGSYRVWCRLA